ncbi:septum formation initiator family protein [Clostridium baratii]|uniref:Septum formation initiator family protein n=2 Tax=Clostridium baratii TaxID=1561 RepID=A0A0A7FZ76_9CLOT|nr:septum formation initiator family protein [Clostridium baratii]AIY84161.1 septum formation initiator family protein [Clostridium baratii str. Sullivan]MDU1054694.1 septum formation initiator family protein [Clostridium baratii]MDU4911485.1 septum formation initiator family protein [Clostridium baratii]CUP75531.1 cell division protein [Clostridium baratii]
MIKKLRGKNLIILVLCLVFLLGFVRQERAMKRIEKEIANKKTELEQIKEKNRELEEQVKSANSEEYNETLARERLNMVKPGEKVINDKKGDSTSKN